jgi:hypothetical protein
MVRDDGTGSAISFLDAAHTGAACWQTVDASARSFPADLAK